MNALYLLDANVLIDANRDYYPIERVPEFWDWLLEMGRNGSVKVPEEIVDEIIGPSTTLYDPLVEWIKNHGDELLLQESVDETLVALVTEQGYASDLTDVEIVKIGRDPFLIAYAYANIGKCIVVTAEVSKPSSTRSNRHIPDVCDFFDVRHCDLFTLIRDLDFRTDWRTRS